MQNPQRLFEGAVEHINAYRRAGCTVWQFRESGTNRRVALGGGGCRTP
jgi:hypothetical protein